jgi:hypothetical protein
MFNYHHICHRVCVYVHRVDFNGMIKKNFKDTEDGRRRCLQLDMALSAVTPARARDKVHQRRRTTRAE